MVMLSIIVPVYNKEPYIDDCIQSIINQSYKEFELILINDGSTDKSGEKCWQYAALDNRIRVIDQENKGVSAARNAGLAYAKGKYIGFVDSDDTVEPAMYSTLLKNALTIDADISSCRLRIIKDGEISGLPQSSAVLVLNHQQALMASLKGELDTNANNKIYRAQMLDDLRFEGVIYEDILFACKAFLRADKTIVENVVMYNYIIRSNSVSMSSFNLHYFETVVVSAEIVKLVSLNDQECLEEAKAFDVMANISLLNLLLLLTEKDRYKVQYNQIVATLRQYESFINTSKAVRKKHKYAWQLFSVSPLLYHYCMRAYCLLTGKDAIKRTHG